MEAKTYLFFGNIGAGKGTQIALLKELLEKNTGKKVLHASPGQEFRNFLQLEGFTNSRAREILNRGNLLPLFLVSYAVGSLLIKEIASDDDHIIFDGFPRSVEQVTVFNSIVDFYARKNLEIIYIDISKEEAVRRLMLRSRADDTDTGIQSRFGEYERNVLPALKVLEEQGIKIHKINGEQAVEGVFNDIKLSLSI